MWNKNGEYKCVCGTIFGKNLLGQQPFGLVYKHLQVCEARKQVDILQKVILLAEAQYMGCGGNLNDTEVVAAMRGVLNDAIKNFV